MNYDTSALYRGMSNNEKYVAASEHLEGTRILLKGVQKSISNSLHISMIIVLSAVPVSVASGVAAGIILGIGASFATYTQFFKHKEIIKKYKGLIEQFKQEEMTFRHAWMSESFKAAAGNSWASAEERDYQEHKAEQDRRREEVHEEAKRRQQETVDSMYREFQENQRNFNQQRGYSGPRYNDTRDATEQRGTFKDCVTAKDVKKVYKLKAKKHHPDVGGDAETFKTLVIQYERALEIAKGK